MPNSNTNGQNQLMWKIIVFALAVILGLVGTIWAITWGSNQKVDVQQGASIAENLEKINDVKSFVAAQEKTNEMILKFMGDQHELSMQILKEVKK